MKKTFLAILLILSLMLCGCNIVVTKESNDGSTQTTPPQTEKKEAYRDIDCRPVSQLQEIYFGFRDSDIAFVMSFPTEWLVRPKTGEYALLRGGTEIGRIYAGEAEDISDWQEISQRKDTSRGISRERVIEMKDGADGPQFRHRITYEYKDSAKRIVTMVCDYAELDKLGSSMVMVAARTEQLGNELNMNMLFDVADGKVIILGNSFIDSSQIGHILQDMLDAGGKSLDMTAVSRGMAEVDTYIGDELLMEEIRNGAYDCVFICGFYALEEADHLAILEEVCKQSDTELVIFPAHNEFDHCIKEAQERCPNLKTLDWRGEINMLIESGVDMREFCIDDAHKHSTPLAGYVGAQMIYRAIYGEIPPAELSDTSVLGQANRLFPDYVKTGKVPADVSLRYFD